MENQLYQYSLINALMAGVGDSGITSKKLASKGNQGLGTFVHMDGELVLVDGRVYHLRSGGEAREADEAAEVPFAMSTFFKAQKTYQPTIGDKSAIDVVLAEFDQYADNLFLSYRIEGSFDYLKCRTVSGQEYEGQSLAELGKKQHVEEYSDVKGVIVGFRSPEAWQGFTVAGHHMHFIDESRRRGGHVLEVKAGVVEMGVAEASDVHIELPKSRSFRHATMKTDDMGVKAIEG